MSQKLGEVSLSTHQKRPFLLNGKLYILIIYHKPIIEFILTWFQFITLMSRQTPKSLWENIEYCENCFHLTVNLMNLFYHKSQYVVSRDIILLMLNCTILTHNVTGRREIKNIANRDVCYSSHFSWSYNRGHFYN